MCTRTLFDLPTSLRCVLDDGHTPGHQYVASDCADAVKDEEVCG